MALPRPIAPTRTFSDLKGMMLKRGVDDANAGTLAGIALAESGGNTHARNPTTTATGLWQIMFSVWVKDPDVGKFIHTRADLEDPEKNADAAVIVFRKQGLKAWTTYTNGDYLKRMDRATPYNPITAAGSAVNNAVSNAIRSGVSGVTGWLTGALKVSGVAILAALLVIAGIVILLRQTAARAVVDTVTDGIGSKAGALLKRTPE